MSSRQITVKDFIGMLKKYPENLLVAIPTFYISPDEMFEGLFDGPSEHNLKVIKMSDARTGFNPSELTGDHDFDVLVIK
jgi:hypothetical protein